MSQKRERERVRERGIQRTGTGTGPCGTNETVVVQHVVVVRGLAAGAANLIKVTHIHFGLKTKTAKKYFSDYSLSPCFNARLFYDSTSEENELFDTNHPTTITITTGTGL